MPLPCPFCGHTPTPELIPTPNISPDFELAVLRCANQKCHVKTKVGSVMPTGTAIAAVIKRWNVRKS
jgi:hypothetical protein